MSASSRPERRLRAIACCTHFNEIIRGIVLRGAALGDMRPELGKLFAILAVMLTFAMARFHKRLD